MTALIVTVSKRCPRCHKKLAADVGQHDDRGDIEIRYYCLNDGYSEQGRNNHASARLTAAKLLARRLSALDRGVIVPMRTDIPEAEPVEAL